jgi:PKD repeat protein
VQYDISSAGRHTIRGVYTFENINGVSASGTQISVDTIILDIERKRLNPILTLSQMSDYAPTIVAFDASASESVAGQIKKFIYDFGEGKPPVEGDAKQTYEYVSAGEKKISLTIVNEA